MTTLNSGTDTELLCSTNHILEYLMYRIQDGIPLYHNVSTFTFYWLLFPKKKSYTNQPGGNPLNYGIETSKLLDGI